MRMKGFTLLLLVNAAAAFPGKLLRVPKVYNALITSKEKILPSEAFPATTGPLFQPIGLPGDPLLVPPDLLLPRPRPGPLDVADGAEVNLPDAPMRSPKPPAPLTFYPRYSLYYPHQPYLTLQQPLLYSQLFGGPPQAHSLAQQMIPKELALEERKDLSLQTARAPPPMLPAPPTDYVKNNRPADSTIPDIPPPPPPVRFRDVEMIR